MAEQIGKAYRVRRGRPPTVDTQQPFDRWLDGSAWALEHGKDFMCSIPTMIARIRRVGTRMEKVVHVQRRGRLVIVVAAKKRPVRPRKRSA